MRPVLENIRKIYFLGIGGIGMSALARYFHSRGIEIHGYDKTATALTDELIAEGMIIHFMDDPSRIPPDTDLAVYTPAIPPSLEEFRRISTSHIPLKKRSEVTGFITEGKTTIAIAGTHGKTSISSLIAHLLKSAGYPVTALVGGICKNYGSNFIASGKDDIMVVEADEYDRSFLALNPDIAVISAIDPDHLDIYGTEGALQDSFREFAARIKPEGMLILRHGLEIKLREGLSHITYAFGETAGISGHNSRTANARQIFDISTKSFDIQDVHLKTPGRHNMENALAACGVGLQLGMNADQIREGIGSFEGVRRRFDTRYSGPNGVYIDDYAHHPKELEAFITAVRTLYPGKKLTGLFQPHLYSRTRDFADGFAASLDLLDEAWLMDIYPARELPIPGVNSSMILQKMLLDNKYMVDAGQVVEWVKQRKPEIFLTIGAGDIDLLAEPITLAMQS